MMKLLASQPHLSYMLLSHMRKH